MSVAKRLRGGLLSAVCLCAACLGCTRAHYVTQGPDSGVVAIPRDTPVLRAQAEKLMHRHMPEGYVIDNVREVAVGPPYRTVTQVGFVREVRWHQDHEVLFTYHTARRPTAVLVPGTTPGQILPAGMAMAPPGQVVPAALPVAPPMQQPAGLPPQPIPVGN